MKQNYSELELEVIKFTAEDVITTSCPPDGCGNDTEDHPIG